jgi:hypothetical protein
MDELMSNQFDVKLGRCVTRTEGTEQRRYTHTLMRDLFIYRHEHVLAVARCFNRHIFEYQR